jgi:hypothetical protein
LIFVIRVEFLIWFFGSQKRGGTAAHAAVSKIFQVAHFDLVRENNVRHSIAAIIGELEARDIFAALNTFLASLKRNY